MRLLVFFSPQPPYHSLDVQLCTQSNRHVLSHYVLQSKFNKRTLNSINSQQSTCLQLSGSSLVERDLIMFRMTPSLHLKLGFTLCFLINLMELFFAVTVCNPFFLGGASLFSLYLSGFFPHRSCFFPWSRNIPKLTKLTKREGRCLVLQWTSDLPKLWPTFVLKRAEIDSSRPLLTPDRKKLVLSMNGGMTT